jgi:hypothetical protein
VGASDPFNKESCVNIGMMLRNGFKVQIYSKDLFKEKTGNDELENNIKIYSLERFCSQRNIGEDKMIIFSDIYDTLFIKEKIFIKDAFIKSIGKRDLDKTILFEAEKEIWPFNSIFWKCKQYPYKVKKKLFNKKNNFFF